MDRLHLAKAIRPSTHSPEALTPLPLAVEFGQFRGQLHPNYIVQIWKKKKSLTSA